MRNDDGLGQSGSDKSRHTLDAFGRWNQQDLFSVTSQRREKSRTTSGFWFDPLEEWSFFLLIRGELWWSRFCREKTGFGFGHVSKKTCLPKWRFLVGWHYRWESGVQRRSPGERQRIESQEHIYDM